MEGVNERKPEAVKPLDSFEILRDGSGAEAHLISDDLEEFPPLRGLIMRLGSIGLSKDPYSSVMAFGDGEHESAF